MEQTVEEFHSSHQSAAEDELMPQYSPTEEGRGIAIQMIPLLIILWNRNSLRKGKRNMKACFNRINLPNHFLSTSSPNASNSCSSRHYEYMNGFSLVNLPHPFKSLFLLQHGGVRFTDHSSLSKLDDMIFKFPIVGFGSEFFCKIIADNSGYLNR